MIASIFVVWTMCGVMSALFMARVFTHNRAREEAQRKLK